MRRPHSSRNRWLVLTLLGLLLPGVAGLLWRASQQTAPPRNVLIVTFDAMRNDHLSHAGYRRKTSPQLDAFASQAVRFSWAHTQGTHTPPSMASLFTGTHGTTHGVTHFTDDNIGKLPPDLAGVLRGAGFATAFVTGHSGFGVFADGLGFERFMGTTERAPQVTARALRWLRSLKGQRFYLHLHYFEPHPGAEIPPAAAQHFAGDGLDLPLKIDPGQGPPVLPPSVPRNDDGTLDVPAALRRYDGSIRYVDRHFGALLAGLEQLQLDRETMVVVSADHGERLGEQEPTERHAKYLEHGGKPVEVVTHVPLLMRVPGLPPAVVNAPVQQLDIMPTVLQELAIPCPATVEGRSLSGTLRGGEAPHEYAFAVDLDTASAAVWWRRWKLIYTTSTVPDAAYWLYDLSRSYVELENVAAANPQVAARLKRELERFMAAHRKRPASAAQGR